MAALLEVSGLRCTFGSLTAVRDVSFEVNGGEVFGLLGPNGAGKTTTVRIICGMQVPDSGEVRFDGQPVRGRRPDVQQRLGVVPQNLAVYPDLNAQENLLFFGALYGLHGSDLRRAVDRALSVTGLADRRRDPAGTFSGGMQRRLNFAIGILHSPDLLILDEPTVGVDPQSRRHLLDCVRDIQESGTGVIYVSHYMEEVEAVCQRVAIIDHGRVLKCDTLAGLLSEVPREVDLLLPDSAASRWQDPPGIRSQITEDGLLLTITDDPSVPEQLTGRLAAVMQQLAERELPLQNIRTQEPGLERLFLELTGHELRD